MLSSATHRFEPFPNEDRRWHETEIQAAMSQVLKSGQFILGSEVSHFENEFAAFLGSPHVVATASGTDSIELMLRCLELRDQAVVVPSFAPSAVAAGVERAGARVLLADVDSESLTLCPKSLRRKLESPAGSQIKAALVVHLYGNPADWEALQQVADDYGIQLLEDAAQAHGGRWKNRALGTLGTLAAFSFYPTKNLGAIGDAGAIATNRADLADQLKQKRQYGWKTRYLSDSTGINSRMDDLQASILRVKLRTLDWQLARRRAWAEKYDQAVGECPLIQGIQVSRHGTHAYHQYVIRCDQRSRLITHLNDQGIPSAILYPAALHQQKAWQQQDSFPVSEKAAAEVLALPLHPYLHEESIDHVCNALKSFSHEG